MNSVRALGEPATPRLLVAVPGQTDTVGPATAAAAAEAAASASRAASSRAAIESAMATTVNVKRRRRGHLKQLEASEAGRRD